MYGTVKYAEYQHLDEEIKRTMKRSAREVVLLGYLLRRMMDEMLWTECYDCIDDYLRKELHMDYTLASRFIGINKKYSINGDSMDIDVRWEGYSQAVLIEMLNMTPELMEKVTPDMTVRQVREMKRQERQEQAEPETVTGNMSPHAGNISPEASEIRPPEDAVEEQLPGQMSLEEVQQDMETDGFPEADEVPDVEYHELEPEEEIATSQFHERIKPDKMQRQYLDDFAKYFISSEWDWFRADHKNRVMDVTKSQGEIKKYLEDMDDDGKWFFRSGNEMMLIKLLDDYIELWDGEDNLLGRFDWFYLAAAIQGMWNVVVLERAAKDVKKTVAVAEECTEDTTSSETKEEPEQINERMEIQRILNRENKTLDEYLAVEGLPERTVFRQKIIVEALAAMVADLETVAPEPAEEPAQPELPVLKNTSQRKEWLKTYRNWGLWYRDDNIGAEYYKYDFDNGARLIAEVYMNEATEFHDTYESCYLHLVGGPKPQKDQHGIGKWAWHEKYSRYPNSETELVEFLKEVQRNG